jgi:hypothetical protein
LKLIGAAAWIVTCMHALASDGHCCVKLSARTARGWIDFCAYRRFSVLHFSMHDDKEELTARWAAEMTVSPNLRASEKYLITPPILFIYYQLIYF